MEADQPWPERGQTRITKSGIRVPGKPPRDLYTSRHGNPLTENQVKVRQRQIRKNGQRTVARGAEYYAYLQSAAWREVKQRYMIGRLPKDCFRCRIPFGPGFEFHHRTYKNLGCERLTDIVPLCRPCHQIVHDGQKLSGQHLWKATTKSRSNLAKRVKAKEKRANRKPRYPSTI